MSCLRSSTSYCLPLRLIIIDLYTPPKDAFARITVNYISFHLINVHCPISTVLTQADSLKEHFFLALWQRDKSVPIHIHKRKEQNPLVSLNRKRVIGSSEISKEPGESDWDVQKDDDRRKKPCWKMSGKHRARRKAQLHLKSELEKVPQHCLPPVKPHNNRY